MKKLFTIISHFKKQFLHKYMQFKFYLKDLSLQLYFFFTENYTNTPNKTQIKLHDPYSFITIFDLLTKEDIQKIQKYAKNKEIKKITIISKLKDIFLLYDVPLFKRFNFFFKVANLDIKDFISKFNPIFQYKLKNLKWPIGVLALILFFMIVITGIFLNYYFVPFNVNYPKINITIEHIVTNVHLGYFMHATHSICSIFFFILLFFHIGLKFFFGVAKKINFKVWISGIFLMLLCFFVLFSGYFLTLPEVTLTLATNFKIFCSNIPILNQLITPLFDEESLKSNTVWDFVYMCHYVIALIIILILFFHIYFLKRPINKQFFSDFRFLQYYQKTYDNFTYTFEFLDFEPLAGMSKEDREETPHVMAIIFFIILLIILLCFSSLFLYLFHLAVVHYITLTPLPKYLLFNGLSVPLEIFPNKHIGILVLLHSFFCLIIFGFYKHILTDYSKDCRALQDLKEIIIFALLLLIFFTLYSDSIIGKPSSIVLSYIYFFLIFFCSLPFFKIIQLYFECLHLEKEERYAYITRKVLRIVEIKEYISWNETLEKFHEENKINKHTDNKIITIISEKFKKNKIITIISEGFKKYFNFFKNFISNKYFKFFKEFNENKLKELEILELYVYYRGFITIWLNHMNQSEKAKEISTLNSSFLFEYYTKINYDLFKNKKKIIFDELYFNKIKKIIVIRNFYYFEYNIVTSFFKQPFLKKATIEEILSLILIGKIKTFYFFTFGDSYGSTIEINEITIDEDLRKQIDIHKFNFCEDILLDIFSTDIFSTSITKDYGSILKLKEKFPEDSINFWKKFFLKIFKKNVIKKINIFKI